MKVYCSKCKHHKSIERYSMHSVCKLTKFTIDSPTGQRVDWEECEDHNTNNDCKNYEPKLLVSLSAKIKGWDKKEDKPVSSRFEVMDL